MNCRWTDYDFQVYSMYGAWNDVPGIYIFAGQGRDGRWFPTYIGKTRSFQTRLSSDHKEWSNSIRLGATHVHALVEQDPERRNIIEQQLIRVFQPTRNTQHR